MAASYPKMIRFLLSCISICLALLTGPRLHAQVVNVPGGGAGPAPGVAFNYRPLGTFWGFDRSQMQFSAAELTAAAVPNSIVITSVGFYLNSLNAPSPSTPVQVYLKEIGGPAGLVPSTYAAATAAATLCFSGAINGATLVAGNWVTIPLTNPFFFNGGGTNLEVIVETNFGGGGGEAFNGKVFSRSTTPGNYYQYWGADNTPPAGNGFVTNTRPDLQINYTPAVPCGAVPGGIAAVSNPSNVCSGLPFTLSVSGLYPPFNSGYTFQWQSAPAIGGPYTNIAGATQAIYTNPGILATTFFRCELRCLAGPPVNSAPVQVNISPASVCYCNSTATSSVDTDIGQVVFGPLTNPAAAGPVTNNPTAFGTYTNFTALPPQNYTQGTAYPITLRQVTSGNFFFAAHFNVFIDYNQDGTFDPVTERVFTGGPTGPTSATPVTTFVTGSITIPFSSLTGITRMRIVLREGGNATSPPCGTYTWGETEDYLINIVPGPPCGLTNAGIATSTLANVCTGQTFVLNVAGTVTLGSGMTWQWQSGPTAGGPWTNIPGATFIPIARTQAATTFYRCQITCGASTLFTAPVQVTQNLPTQCYCIPLHIPNCNNMWTSRVAFNTLNNLTGCSSNTGLAYNVYPASGLTTTTVTQNQTYNLSVQTSGTINAIISVWIDYNFNGLYEATEWQQVAVSNPPGSTAVIPITIPGTTGTGLTGMRIRSRFSGNPNNATSACITFGSGETEDYFITINPFIPPPCTGVPGPFTTAASATTVCSGQQVILTLNPNAATIFDGLTYQWQSAPALAGPWTNIAGATLKQHTVNPVTTEYYRCVVTCTNSGSTVNSAPVLITVQPATWLGFTDDWNDPTNWCGRVPTLADDAQVSLAASGRPAASYFFPVVAVGDTMRARNLLVAATDSVTVLTDTTVSMNIAQDLNNNGRFSIVYNSADSITFGTQATTSGLIQIFKGAIPDNIVQVIYTASELSAAGMLPGDVIDSLYFRFYNRTSAVAYQNFSIAYSLIPAATDQFTGNDPLLGVTNVYTNANLLVTNPVAGVYTAFTATTGVLKLPVNNIRWDGTSNLLLQICYDMTFGIPAGTDFMYLSSTAPRKSCLWLGSTNVATSGCSLTSASAGLQPNFGQVPSTFRPNIGFRFKRPQILMNGLISGNLNNNVATSRFWTSFADITITGSINNAIGASFSADTSTIRVDGNYNNNGTTDFSYAPGFVNRKSFMIFRGVNWNNNGVFTSGNSRVSFAGSVNQLLGGANPTAFHEYEVNKVLLAQMVTQLRNITVDDTLFLTQGQHLMNLNSITLNNGASCAGSLTAPTGPVTRTNGMLISESFSSLFNWNNIGTTIGFRVVPFGSAAVPAPLYISFTFRHSTGDLGNLSVATYTASLNLPLPPTVSHLNNAGTSANNAVNTVDRFWWLAKTGANPVTDICFRFTPAERPAGMSALNAGRAQPWRSLLTNQAWIRLVAGFGTSVTYTQTYGQVIAQFDSVRVANFDWPVLPAGGAPFFAPSAPLGNSNPWTITSNTQSLPVELLHFSAVADGERTRLNWSTASEEQSDYFFIERTLDFKTVELIAKAPAAGYSNDLMEYEAWDEHPFEGINYYRLKQVDLDGTVNEVSDYVPVGFGKGDAFEIVYVQQNQLTSVFFRYNSDEPVVATLYDAMGRMVLEQRDIAAVPGMNQLEMSTAGLAGGIYTLVLRNTGKMVNHKFMFERTR